MRRAVVVNGHTLGVVMCSMAGMLQLQILRASQLAGSSVEGDPCTAIGCLMFDPAVDAWRDATERDFLDFRVCSHPDYFKEFVDPLGVSAY